MTLCACLFFHEHLKSVGLAEFTYSLAGKSRNFDSRKVTSSDESVKALYILHGTVH